MKKKILITLIAICTMLFAFGMINASAATVDSGACGENLTWTLDDNGMLVISGSGAMTKFIPSSVPWYSNRATIETIVIDDDVTSIGNYAFYNCSNLTSITIPDSITNIGDYAFENCRSLDNVYITDIAAWCNIDFYSSTSNPLSGWGVGNLYLNNVLITDLTIPSGVTKINDYAFYHCSNLTSITIPDSVTSIGHCAFWDCYTLSYIMIPDSLTSVAEQVFGNCSVENVLYCGTEEQWDLLNLQNTYLKYNKIYYDAVSVQEIDGIKYLVGKDYAILLKANINIEGNVTVPDTIDNIPVTQISDKAFYECEGLTSIIIPESVKSIGNYAFYNCNKLTDITIPDAVTSIGNYAFSDCSSLTSVTIGDSVTSIGEAAFYNCNSIESVYITSLSSYLNIDYYDVYAIPMRVAKKLYINGKRAQNITIPDSVARIPDYAFHNIDSIEKVTIEGNNLVEIGQCAFYSCINLTDINIPCSVKKIQGSAFANCYNLDVVYITDIGTWCNIEFEDKFAHPFVHHGGDLYLNEKLLTELELSDSVTEIKDYAFYRCRAITKMILPETITNIGEYAFYGCGLTSIVIPDSVSSIESYAFCGCELLELEIGNGIVSIPGYTFSDCSSLSEVTLPHSISEIESKAFNYCNKITTVNYNGNEDSWNDVYIASSGNEYLKNATRNYFWYVRLYDENGKLYSKTKYEPESVLDLSTVPQKIEHTVKVYTDKECTIEYNADTPITENLDLYYKHTLNEYFVKFYDENGSFIKEFSVGYGLEIPLPETPTKERTQQYTYTFSGWDGHTDKMVMPNYELKFKAAYTATVNQYTYKFVDDNGGVLKEETVDYGTTIEAPANPTKDATAQYTYTFGGWSGYTEGMTLTDDIIFTAAYNATVNQYTYQFIDDDGTEIKSEKVDYGTVITVPETPADKDAYTFDYWEGYTDGMTVSGDISFKAVYKYKVYQVSVAGYESLNAEVIFNRNYTITPAEKYGYEFLGYYTEENGSGTQITDEKGNSLAVYGVEGNSTVYPYFKDLLCNKAIITGVDTVTVGDENIKYTVSLGTDKADIRYTTIAVKYPKDLTLKSVESETFDDTPIDETIEGDTYNVSKILCIYSYDEEAIPTLTPIEAFELIFDVNKTAVDKDTIIELTQDSILMGDSDYPFDNLINTNLKIQPKLAENILIDGLGEIDKPTQYTATVYPDYAKDRTVTWSVNDETVATISQNGILTPVKNGTVTVTATANDGSGVVGTKVVNVIAYAQIIELTTDGEWSEAFENGKREYIVYVDESATNFNISATYPKGSLKVNGSTLLSGREKNVVLTDTETTITLDRSNVEEMTNISYTLTVIRTQPFIKAMVSEDGKSFNVRAYCVDDGSTVILSLYDDKKFVKLYNDVSKKGEIIPFAVTETYDEAKVMVWESLSTLKPLCEVVRFPTVVE